MIDPITIGAAFAVAKTSVAFVKEAINMGKEIRDCYGELSKFFTAQGQIEKAAKQVEAAKAAPKPDDPKEAAAQESVLSQAFTIVMQRKQAKEFEQELRDLFSLKGEMALYEELCAERNRISGEQDEANRERIRKARLERDRATRKREELEQVLSVAGIVIFVLIGAVLLYVAITSRG
jgi:hypothetical protein